MTATGPRQPADKALILDVDGVISPVHGHTAWGDDTIAGTVLGDDVHVSPTMCERLHRLGNHPGVIPVWLTSWTPAMRATMRTFPGRTWQRTEPAATPRERTRTKLTRGRARGLVEVAGTQRLAGQAPRGRHHRLVRRRPPPHPPRRSTTGKRLP
jgi:hypothetical protein